MAFTTANNSCQTFIHYITFITFIYNVLGHNEACIIFISLTCLKEYVGELYTKQIRLLIIGERILVIYIFVRKLRDAFFVIKVFGAGSERSEC